MEKDLRRAWQKRSDAKSALVVAAHVGFVYGPIYWAVSLGPSPLWLLCWGWFGLFNQGLLNLMHECAHRHVFRSRAGSEWLGHWVLAPLVFSSFSRYRDAHFAHHQHIGTAHDPKYSYTIALRGWRLLGACFRSLVLIEALRKFRGAQGPVKDSSRSEKAWVWLGRTLVVQSIFFASLLGVGAMAGHSWRGAVIGSLAAYAVIYLYGILSLTVLMANLRAVAEHQPHEWDLERHGTAVLRNLKSNPLTHLVFGAYGFSDHATHHWQPAIPYYHLRAETERLSATEPGALPAQGYVASLVAAVKPTRKRPPIASTVVPE